ncbi:MAG: alkaline phosphatase family protein [Phycisphaerales bacterium]
MATANRLAEKLLIVGWDAADWKLMDPLMVRGRLPNVRRLLQRGVRADLRTLEPRLSPLLWNSVATGKRADKHGILNFVEPEPTGAGIRPSTSTTRKTKALWNMLSQRGLRTVVVGWYASHPAEPIRGGGVCVSNMYGEGCPRGAKEPWPLTPGCVHPEELAGLVGEARVHPSRVDPKELRALAPEFAKLPPSDVRVGLLQRLLAQAHTVHAIAKRAMKAGGSGGWDCAMVFNEAIDVFGHHFMGFHPPKMAGVSERDFNVFKGVMDGVYELQDRMLGELIALAGPEACVILLSDHGFHSDHLRPATPPAADDKHAALDATWHREHGVLIIAGPENGGIVARSTPQAPREVLGATLLDITPTALTLLGLPTGLDMDGRVLVEAFEHSPVLERIESWDAVEGAEPGASGMHPADMRVDTLESAQSIKQLIELGYLADMSGDEQAMLDNVDRETRFNLAVVKQARGDFLAAIELLGPLSESKPEEARYAITLAQNLYNAGQFERARVVVEGFLSRCPGHADAAMVLAGALIAEGKPGEAAQRLEREAAASDKPNPDRDCLLGTAYLEMKDAQNALRVFGRAAATDPHHARARLGLAQAEMLRKNFEPAAEHAFEAVQLQHFLPEAHYTLGACLAHHGVATGEKEFAHALQFLNIAISMQPGYLDAHRYLAAVHARRGDEASASKHRGIAEELMGRIGKTGGFVDPLSE